MGSVARRDGLGESSAGRPRSVTRRDRSTTSDFTPRGSDFHGIQPPVNNLAVPSSKHVPDFLNAHTLELRKRGSVEPISFDGTGHRATKKKGTGM